MPALTNQGRFPKTAFAIDLDAGTCACPGGQTTTTFWANPTGEGGGRFTFPVATCLACPLRDQCVKGTGGRPVEVHPQEPLLQQARAFQASDAFAEVRRRRQAAEHRLARVVQLGLRQARYVGHAKTLFQLALAAAVANLTRLAASDFSRGPSTATEVALAALGSLLAVLAVLVFARSAQLMSAAAHPLYTPWWPPALPCRPWVSSSHAT